MSSEAPRPQGLLGWIVLGVLLGGAVLAGVLILGNSASREVEEYFPRATPEAVAAWTKEWHTRGDRWAEVPDPPGEGDVVRAWYWLARDRYDMEVRRRGKNFVVSIGGVADHIHGGAWRAFGEGTITGNRKDFRGAVATFTWGCLGLRYRHASDGVGRIVFDDDGNGCNAIYMAFEAPKLWSKSYGVRHAKGQEPPPYGAYRGQIPVARKLEKLSPGATYRVRVRVTGEDGLPKLGALVRLKGRPETSALTNREGRCEIEFRGSEALYAQVIGAGALGYYNGEAVSLTGDALPGLVKGGVSRGEMSIALRRVDLGDHADYEWVRASGDFNPDDVMACGTCHPWHYDQWFGSRHARSADHGHVIWERARMLEAATTAPDDCHGCHQPAHAAKSPQGTYRPRGTMAGNHCDFCHKIQAVGDIHASGVLGSIRLARPDPKGGARPGGIHHVFGTAPDVTYPYMGASRNPLFTESHLCAGCHQGGGAAGLPKLDTYEEWKRWVVKRPPEEAQTCQGCHMPAGGMKDASGKAMDQMAWDAMHRSPEQVHGHRFFGSEPPFASNALDLKVAKRRDEATGEWIVEVSVTNTGAGHKVPTGTWSKHVVVGVWAERGGKPLKQVGGERAWLAPEGEVPEGALAPGDWRNPGGFVLSMRAASDPEGRLPPPVFWATWAQDGVIDLRLKPGETRKATCRFEAGEGDEDAIAEVRIIHRRGWLPGGTASVPWSIRPNDPPPQVLWWRLRK